MPRITSGNAKNKQIKVPKIDNIRVVQDIVKLALFSIITNEKLQNTRCLDLFAGSGSFGLEALSRGAGWCDFVDESRKATEIIQKNLEDTRLTDKADVITTDSTKYAANTEFKYDLIFVDPFYHDIKHRFLLKNLEEIINDDGLIAFTHGENLKIEEQIEETGLHLLTQRRFGKSFLSILSKERGA
jgi:16S rRNA (guanine966-N2)-methyltransferase